VVTKSNIQYYMTFAHRSQVQLHLRSMCKSLSEIHDGFVLALCKNSFSKDNNKKALTAAELTSLKYGM